LRGSTTDLYQPHAPSRLIFGTVWLYTFFRDDYQVEEIITTLSRIRWLSVIGRKLCVRYVLQSGGEASSARRRVGIVRIGAARANFSALSGSKIIVPLREPVAPLT